MPDQPVAPPSSKLPWLIAGVLGCAVLGLLGTVGVLLVVLLARPGSPEAPPAAAVAGLVSGTVRDESGKPIAVPGAVVTIVIRGTSDRGERQVLKPAVDANGHFELRPPPGLYAVEGTIAFTYEGLRYRFTLCPADGVPPPDRPSANGIVTDFVWKLTGPIPGANPQHYTGHYGGYLHVSGYLANLPAETKLAFKLEPLSPRVDGAPAPPASWVVTRAQLDAQSHLGEVPLAKYRLSGTATWPDGATAPLHWGGNDWASSPATIDVFFRPGGAGITDNVDPALVHCPVPPHP